VQDEIVRSPFDHRSNDAIPTASAPFTRDVLGALLGPVAVPGPLAAELHEEVACDGYVRRLVSYDVPAGRATAFVCVPDTLTTPAPVVFCHHQHAGEFDLGKSEVCGLRGSPDQAYAAELAQRGFLTIAPDAIGFEDRNWAGGRNLGWFELSSRLVRGRTLLADCLQEISLAIDYVTGLPEADPQRIGFVGHSYGGRAAMWAPAWDNRIRMSVSNCGCIPYRHSFARDAGFQAEFVVPDFATSYDVEDVLAVATQCQFLIIAAEDDRWSRGAREIEARLRERRADHVRVHVVPGGHEFRGPQRTLAYEFLDNLLAR
jgi:dienelactone hydrolase